MHKFGVYSRRWCCHHPTTNEQAIDHTAHAVSARTTLLNEPFWWGGLAVVVDATVTPLERSPALT